MRQGENEENYTNKETSWRARAINNKFIGASMAHCASTLKRIHSQLGLAQESRLPCNAAGRDKVYALERGNPNQPEAGGDSLTGRKFS